MHSRGRRKVWIIAALAFVLTAGFSAPAAAETVEETGLVDKSAITVRSFMADSQMEWLQQHLKGAKAVLIIPSLVKLGFVLGGSGGSGVLLVRDEKTGSWSQPAFYMIGSVTFGLQIGGEAAEVIMLIQNQKALDQFYATEFKLGGDVSVAAGPVGAGAKSNIMADVLSFAKSKGLYAGLNLEGSIIKVSDSSNHAYYGRAVRPIDILVRNAVSNPGSAELRQELANAVR
ncbi:lipid-binding SYLF domain-containing protein [Desulfatiglans anilini]|uniref:lipid-binding SYLF domain-containing protein n=1 Tax=Desulfatiglans anilini TaxID=90728 RepID=UPI0003FD95A8|nr:lipid-binding SYLF domain-containing protein [Desulfatiglans anilini]